LGSWNYSRLPGRERLSGGASPVTTSTKRSAKGRRLATRY
jgi:hypothetical protein